MFVRPEWEPLSEEDNFALIDAFPWGILISNGENGPLATNLPLLLDRSRGSQGTLVSHIAVANRQAAALRSSESAPTLAIFHGPHSYVTASWYPHRDMPSTFYYTAVHCYGQVRVQSETELERWLNILTEKMEGPIENGWKITDVPDADIKRRLKYIVGFEIEIDRIEGKYKLGQDEPKKDAMAVGNRLADSPEAELSDLAGMIHRFNAAREEKT